MNMEGSGRSALIVLSWGEIRPALPASAATVGGTWTPSLSDFGRRYGGLLCCEAWNVWSFLPLVLKSGAFVPLVWRGDWWGWLVGGCVCMLSFVDWFLTDDCKICWI